LQQRTRRARSRIIFYSNRIQLVAEIEDAPQSPTTEKPGKIGE